MSPKILLVEDDFALQQTVANILRSDADITPVASLAEARAQLKKSVFDLVLLDLGLPDGDGFSLYPEIQERHLTGKMPIIFLTGRDEISSKVTAFALGAEDYIVKPFNGMELLARVRARLRKTEKKNKVGEEIRFADLRFEVPLQRVYYRENDHEMDLNLTPSEFKILLLLVKHWDQVHSREQLIELIWKGKESVLERTVDAHISNLKKKLPRSCSCVIKSVHGVGYQIRAGKRLSPRLRG